jgi:ComF family protein
MRQWLFDITGFFFPVYCPVCNTPMHIPEQVICLKCEQKMPRTNYTEDPNNPVAELFWGRIQLKGASSLFRFEKGSKYQTLLHLLKYKGEKRIGIFLGKLLGAELLNTSFQQVDFIVPVPLHKKREKKRGYNQSEIIAEGFAIITELTINTNVIFRNEHTDSQTRKNRIERWENMENVFRLFKDSKLPENPSFLLIDDVVTTGSTLEACAAVLMTIPGASVYIATVACA